MGQCTLFWIIFLLLVMATAVVWLKSPRPNPVPAEKETPEARLNDKVRTIFLYLLGFIALMDLFFYFRDGTLSDLFFALSLIVYLAYSYAYAKRPPSRWIEALVLLVMLAFITLHFYYSICLGL